MNKNNIVEMEKKLEQTGMGILYNRKDHLSSQDEKIIRMNAADARKEAESGFTKEAEVQRFKEYDEKIRRSDNAMKKRELAGVDPFCKWKAPHPVEPIAPVQPKQHVSMSLVDSSCDSVNPRRQENCHLCSKSVKSQVVYLAERMQVESMYIHKNCFRCAYCGQPLRLGEYGKDKDLEYHYSKNKEICETLIQEKNLLSAETMISTQTPTSNLSTKKIRYHVFVFFKAFAIIKLLFFFIDLTSVDDVKERSESVEMDDEESLTDDDDAQLEEDDLEELERTVLQIADENPEKPFTDAQVNYIALHSNNFLLVYLISLIRYFLTLSCIINKGYLALMQYEKNRFSVKLTLQNPSISRSETPVNPEKVHCESRKETNILGNAFRRLKMKRGETTSEPQLLSTQGMSSFSPPQSSSVTISTDNREVPCAAVAPSPRIHSVNNKNIRLFQKKAEKIRRYIHNCFRCQLHPSNC
uniref:LIM zinc-binding domain-containing protein n=1 Tax=Heterorhabditis bacteriophora TaxID=37862 RepID=A0A1I7WV93_HETBA